MRALNGVALPFPMTREAMSLPAVQAVVSTMLDKLRLRPRYTLSNVAHTSVAVYNQSLTEHPEEFRFLVVEDLGHQYANGKNNPVVYADIFWEFFQRFARP
ncbi:MAG: hypothetical protein P0120_00145 [Nitrospira sp.]|nr:hypothetical protein [Nitrospira sp.]